MSQTLRNVETGEETTTLHRLGTTEAGATLYARVEGWEPTGLCAPADEDGNWVDLEWAVEEAEAEGRRYRSKYEDEFGEEPDREEIGDWDSAAWESAWGDLRYRLSTVGVERDQLGDDGYTVLLDSFMAGLFGEDG